MNAKPWLEEKAGKFFVGCRFPEAMFENGPTAEVSADDTWVNIITDDCEGHAMLNIETLPLLLKALKELHRRHKADRKPYQKTGKK